MKVESRNWQSDASVMYTSASHEKLKQTNEKQTEEKQDKTKTDEWSRSLENLEELSAQASQKADSSSSGSKIKSSVPDDSVGELAAMLARAETRIDVQQVASKAVRALTNLKMSAAASEGKEAKKIAQMIRRMEKLIKRIQKKMQHLSKEEQLEYQQKRAEKKQDMEKIKQIKEELNTRRKRRHRDEKRYASKELAEDAKMASNELVSSVVSAASPTGTTPSFDFSSMTGMDGFASMEGGSVDIMV